jgi:hypothetical protein
MRVLCCLIDYKWRYIVDNDFATTVLSPLATRHTQKPQQGKQCCLSCERLILPTLSRQTTNSSPAHCILCEVLDSVRTEHGQEVSATATFERDNSHLLLGDKKVLAIRRSIGKGKDLCASTNRLAAI